MNRGHDTRTGSTVKPSSFGRRLREERDRLGISQADLATTGGVARTTQHIYEADIRVPDVNYLNAIRGVGIDVVYVLFGERQPPASKGMPPLNSETAKRIFEFVLDAGKDDDGDPFPRDRLVQMFETLCALCSNPEASARKVDPQALWSTRDRPTGT